MTPNDLAVRQMIERVIELTRTYAIWWQIVEKSNLDRYSMVIESHEDFFTATTHSLFQGFTIVACQLFEKKENTISLRSLVDVLALTDSTSAQRLETDIKGKWHLIKKVIQIRGNVYAHRNKIRPPETLFSEVGLTSNEMREILDLARDVVSSLAESAGIEPRADIEEKIRRREEYSREDARRIMEALEKHAH